MHISKYILLPILAIITPLPAISASSVDPSVFVQVGENYEVDKKWFTGEYGYLDNPDAYKYYVKNMKIDGSFSDTQEDFLMLCRHGLYKIQNPNSEKKEDLENMYKKTDNGLLSGASPYFTYTNLCSKNEGSTSNHAFLVGCKTSDNELHSLRFNKNNTLRCLFSEKTGAEYDDPDTCVTSCDAIYPGTTSGDSTGANTAVQIIKQNDAAKLKSYIGTHLPWSTDEKSATVDTPTGYKNSANGPYAISCTIFARPMWNYKLNAAGTKLIKFDRYTEFKSGVHIKNFTSIDSECYIGANTFWADETGAYEYVNDCYSMSLRNNPIDLTPDTYTSLQQSSGRI